MRVGVAFDHRAVVLRERMIEEIEALSHDAVDEARQRALPDYGWSFLAWMTRSTMSCPPLPLFSLEFWELWTATARGHGSFAHQPKNGPPDCPGQTSA